MLEATSPQAWIGALVRFERELAAAEADVGLISAADAAAITEAATRLRVDATELAEDARATGNPVVPLVRAIRDDDDLPVHFGATSQDAMDSAAMLVSAGACRVLVADLEAAADACARLAEDHRATIMTARTLLQPALPTTFGLQAAGWLGSLDDARAAVLRASGRLPAQLGGAAGTLAAFGDRGLDLAAALAARLGLAEPVLPWHTDRSCLVELGAALAMASNAAAKVALDVVLLSQAEVGELSEGGATGHGGSSAMPHKQNAVTSVTVLAAARRAHAAYGALVSSGVQDLERAATGGWHAEWPSLTDLWRAAGGCAHGVAIVLEGLSVHADRMQDNVQRSAGAIVTERVALDLGKDLGRAASASLVARASRTALDERRELADVLSSVPEISARRSRDELEALCDPAGYLGASADLVARALERHAAMRAVGTPRRDARRAGAAAMSPPPRP